MCDKIGKSGIKGEIGLENAENCKTDHLDVHRKKRIKRLKKIICITVAVLLILPTFICVIMFQKLMHLQKQVDVLMINSYGTTFRVGESKIKAQISDNNLFFEENLYLKAEEYAASLEDSKENEYNIEESIESDKVEQNGQADNINLSPNKIELDKNVQDNMVDSKLSGKKVYLTFDDGPSIYTDQILDILGKYNVKATFFVIGKTDEESKRLYQRIVNEGHTLGLHSFSHDYKKVYQSVEDFEKDFTKLRDLLYDTTGYFPTIFRFPGGSGNTVSREDMSVFIEYLNKESVVYFDWNVINGDATGEKLTATQSYNNVLNGVKLHNRSIVLMHDTDKKESTVKSLESILKTLTENNAKLLPLNDDVIPIQQVSNSSKELNK